MIALAAPEFIAKSRSSSKTASARSSGGMTNASGTASMAPTGPTSISPTNGARDDPVRPPDSPLPFGLGCHGDRLQWIPLPADLQTGCADMNQTNPFESANVTFANNPPAD